MFGFLKGKGKKTVIDSSAKEEAEKYKRMAAMILEGMGGKENLSAVSNDATRLLFEVRDYAAVDEAKVKAAGASGIIRYMKTSVSVIAGPKASSIVAEEIQKLCK